MDAEELRELSLIMRQVADYILTVPDDIRIDDAIKKHVKLIYGSVNLDIDATLLESKDGN